MLGGADEPAGDGEVAAEDAPDDEGSAEEFSGQGVEIEVTPAGKATRRLSLLSGGEKSLVALAFVFSVFLARPSPFYILDEVEAALDDANIDRFLQLIGASPTAPSSSSSPTRNGPWMQPRSSTASSMGSAASPRSSRAACPPRARAARSSSLRRTPKLLELPG